LQAGSSAGGERKHELKCYNASVRAAADNTEIVNLDAIALARAIKTKQVSCVEVMNAYLDRIERLNPRVNAIVSLQPREVLLEEAATRDAQLARGEYLGWMHGFPHAVKDLEPTRGIRTTMGSPLFRNFVPREDSIMVERLRRAGAVIIGKTNVPEFGLGSQTYNPVFGTTLNAYDQSKTSGGSSGGAAVALALRMLPVADGGDNGGSLRNPAVWNNVFGLRTSFGRVPSQFNEVFIPSISVHGPMARTVADLAMLLSVIAGYDARVPLSIREDPAAFAAPLARDFKGTRIGWVGDFGGRIPFDPGVLELCAGALKVFESLGCIVETAVPDYPLEPVWDSWCKIRGWQIAAMLNGPFADPARRALMKPELQWEIENGLKATAFEVVEANLVRTAWYQAVRRFFEKYDFMIAPAGQVFPFDATVHWPKEVGGVSMDTYHRWMQVMIPISMSGCPALGATAGFNDAGLPMGIQIAGPNQAELACMQIAHAYEEATKWVMKHPPLLLGS
jgi:amidase